MHSFADWNIQVFDNGTEQTTEYHVNRTALAFGPRRSEYFVGVFRSDGLHEANEKVTLLELSRKEAEAFPSFLDYVYTGVIDFEVKSITALFSLADYFMVRPLKPHLKVELSKGLSGEDLANLYKDAMALEMESS